MSLEEYVSMLPQYITSHWEQRETVKAQLLERLRAEITSATQMNDILESLRSFWNEDEVAAFRSAATSCLNALLNRQHLGKTQDYTRFPLYVSEGWLAKFKAKANDDVATAITVISFLKKLGLRNPTEETVRSITAFVLSLSTVDHSKDSSDEIYQMVCGMKKLCRGILQGSDMDWPWTNPQWMQALPGRTSDLDPLWRHHAMGSELPMSQPAIPLELIAARSATIPLRKSHRDLQQNRPASAATPLEFMGTMFKEALSIVAQKEDPKTKGKICMLTPPPRKTKPPLLALEDARPKEMQAVKEELASPGDAKGNLLSAFSPERSQNEEANGESSEAKVSKMPTKEPGTILDQAQALNQALHGKPLPQKSSRGRPVKMARPASVLETPKKAVSVIDRIGSPYKRPAKQATMKRPSASTGLSKLPADKPGPDAKTGFPQKRPASKAASSSKDAKIPKTLFDDDGNPKITGKQRLKWYPEGCSKCREQPGCTRSCYKVRKEL